MKNRYKIPIFLFTFMLIVSVAGASYCYFLLYTTPAPDDSAPSRFTIGKGESLDSISRRLFEQKLIVNPVSLKLASFFIGGSQAIKAGSHKLEGGKNAWEMLEILKQSPLKEFVIVTIPEGWDSFEIALALEKAGFSTRETLFDIIADPSPIADLAPEATSLEGFLFPDTYHVPVDASATDIIRMMIKRSRELLNKQISEDFANLGLTLEEGVILASLIAKEAGNAEEMPDISSVFHNRMRIGMKLDCDPTFIYAAKLAGVWDHKVHRSDIDRESPYNTYLYQGLPPGPIGNPGETALHAAAHPTKTNYIYFVAKGADQSSGHYFSSTFAQHQKAVALYRQAKRSANE